MFVIFSYARMMKILSFIIMLQSNNFDLGLMFDDAKTSSIKNGFFLFINYEY